MSDIGFEFKPGDGSTQSDAVNKQLAAIIKTKTNAIRRFGRVRIGDHGRASKGINAANVWADAAESIVVLTHDIKRAASQLVEIKDNESKGALREQLGAQLDKQRTQLEALAKNEPGLRSALASLLAPAANKGGA